ncbi:hypothetical protein [Occallatibacter riparius]|uniref:Uncharacterized protein n=1 Tax=Occallatibacter riparius TaxID=1002689 RepID=A0A9J7BSQ9_9BACT|nr:hypothetical protein [Occallatibacter riparius]UWZ84061.1 hypothetical protein MOP44_26325 [Occallatibacter riparius]
MSWLGLFSTGEGLDRISEGWLDASGHANFRHVATMAQNPSKMHVVNTSWTRMAKSLTFLSGAATISDVRDA